MRSIPRLFLCAALAAACDRREVPLAPPLPVDSARPPPADAIRVDRFAIGSSAVDLLFVVDNSSSMAEEHEAVAANLVGFVATLDGDLEDWHLGLVSTDVQRPEHTGSLRTGRGVRYLDADTVDPAGALDEMVESLEVIAGSVESGRAAVYHALELKRDTPQNQGFYRESAALHVVFVSDDDDQSGSNPVTRNEFLSWIAALKPHPSWVEMHAIVGLEGEPSCVGQPVYPNPPKYLGYVEESGGLLAPICSDDWGDVLDGIGSESRRGDEEFFLTAVPAEVPALRVEVHPAPVDGVYRFPREFAVCRAGVDADDPDCEVVYDGVRNSVAFIAFAPEPLDEVRVTYALAEAVAAGVAVPAPEP